MSRISQQKKIGTSPDFPMHNENWYKWAFMRLKMWQAFKTLCHGSRCTQQPHRSSILCWWVLNIVLQTHLAEDVGEDRAIGFTTITCCYLLERLWLIFLTSLMCLWRFRLRNNYNTPTELQDARSVCKYDSCQLFRESSQYWEIQMIYFDTNVFKDRQCKHILI